MSHENETEKALRVAEEAACLDWGIRRHNYSQYASGYADFDLSDGRVLQVIAGWNSEGSHENCNKHIAVGRASTACMHYDVHNAAVPYETKYLTRAEALALVEETRQANVLDTELGDERDTSYDRVRMEQ